MIKSFENVSSKLKILWHFEQKDPTNSFTFAEFMDCTKDRIFLSKYVNFDANLKWI